MCVWQRLRSVDSTPRLPSLPEQWEEIVKRRPLKTQRREPTDGTERQRRQHLPRLGGMRRDRNSPGCFARGRRAYDTPLMCLPEQQVTVKRTEDTRRRFYLALIFKLSSQEVLLKGCYCYRDSVAVYTPRVIRQTVGITAVVRDNWRESTKPTHYCSYFTLSWFLSSFEAQTFTFLPGSGSYLVSAQLSAAYLGLLRRPRPHYCGICH